MKALDDCPFVGTLPDPSHAYRRVKALALAALIQAGGKPCWVAAYAPATSAASAIIPATPPRAAARSPAALPCQLTAPRSAAPPPPAQCPPGLSADELARLGSASPKLLASMARAFAALDRPASPPRS